MKYIALLFLVNLSMVSHAGNIYCQGKIDNTYIHSNGDVIIKGAWRSHWTKVCNTGDADVVNCSLWASYIASAVQNNLNVTVMYSVDDSTTCANLPTYANAPKPEYIMIHNNG